MGAQRFTETGDPRYVHKIAVFMDRMADIYYGLPLSDCNELARRKDGRQITRADWESLPRPVPEGDVFGHRYQARPAILLGEADALARGLVLPTPDAS